MNPLYNFLTTQNIEVQRKPHPKVKFTPEEDMKLRKLVEEYGENNWNTISEKMEGRNTRQCRERWRYYLSPDINNDPWTAEEDKLLDQKYMIYGPKWKQIATFFSKRTDINVKSRWHVHMRKAQKKSRTLNKKERKPRAEKVIQQSQLQETNNKSYLLPKINENETVEDDQNGLFNFENFINIDKEFCNLEENAFPDSLLSSASFDWF